MALYKNREVEILQIVTDQPDLVKVMHKDGSKENVLESELVYSAEEKKVRTEELSKGQEAKEKLLVAKEESLKHEVEDKKIKEKQAEDNTKRLQSTYNLPAPEVKTVFTAEQVAATKKAEEARKVKEVDDAKKAEAKKQEEQRVANLPKVY